MLYAYVTNDVGFITSDAPCAWVNPKAQTFPPGLRHPALGQPEIEVTLPLTPQHLLLISHVRYPLYVDVPQSTVDNANGIRLDFCTEEFLSWKGGIRSDWFKVPEQQAASWENTPEGKEAMAQHEQGFAAPTRRVVVPFDFHRAGFGRTPVGD